MGERSRGKDKGKAKKAPKAAKAAKPAKAPGTAREGSKTAQVVARDLAVSRGP